MQVARAALDVIFVVMWGTLLLGITSVPVVLVFGVTAAEIYLVVRNRLKRSNKKAQSPEIAVSRPRSSRALWKYMAVAAAVSFAMFPAATVYAQSSWPEVCAYYILYPHLEWCPDWWTGFVCLSFVYVGIDCQPAPIYQVPTATPAL